MIRLNLSNRPEWLDLLPGLRVLVAPLTTALMVSARADPLIDNLSDASSQEDMALAMAKAVARRAVLEWEGVGDEAGYLVPVSPAGIDALLEIWPVFEAFQAQYVARGLMLGLISKKLPITPIDPIETGGVIALVGPTGAGKTTTIAKLASRFAETHAPRDEALVTTDTQRIGARDQRHRVRRADCLNHPEGDLR